MQLTRVYVENKKKLHVIHNKGSMYVVNVLFGYGLSVNNR